MIIDLHIHTTASDGKFSPEEIIFQAQKARLSSIAITDHDTIDGILQLNQQKLFSNSNITIIPGIEFSTDLPGYEVHILGYFIDVNSPKLLSHLEILKEHRHNRLTKMLIKLNKLGYNINQEDVMSVTNKTTSIGRSHIAQALIKKGYFSSTQDVFHALLNNNGPAYIPHFKYTPSQVVQLIKHCNGIPVLAHPGLIKNDNIVLNMIKAGLEGMEVFHPKHSAYDTIKYLSMAKQYSLQITGGSDFHGIDGRFPKYLGIFTVPRSIMSSFEG